MRKFNSLKSLGVCTSAVLVAMSLSVSISSFADSSPLPSSGFFVGLGASDNSINLNQDLYASGVSNVYDAGVLYAYGEAGGPASPYNDTQTTFAPEGQLGYFRTFGANNGANNSWLWGAKFTYSYLDSSSTNQSVDVPQFGSFTKTAAGQYSGPGF